jgi:hypothetical protein
MKYDVGSRGKLGSTKGLGGYAYLAKALDLFQARRHEALMEAIARGPKRRAARRRVGPDRRGPPR